MVADDDVVPPGTGRLALLRSMGRELLFTLLFEPIAAVDKTAIMLRLLAGGRIGWPARSRSMIGRASSVGIAKPRPILPPDCEKI